MKKIIEILTLLFCLFIFPIELTHAESGETIPVEQALCSDFLHLEWPSEVKVGSTHEYQIISTGSGNVDFSSGVTYTLRRDKKIVEKIWDREKYLRYFTTPWIVSLEANISWNPLYCERTNQKDIRVYSSKLTYIWTDRNGIDTGINDIFEKNNIHYKNYIQKTSLSEIENIQDIWNDLDQSDMLIVWSTDILWFFSDIVKLQKTKVTAHTIQQ